MATDKRLLSELEAAVRLGLSPRTMRRIREEGLIAFTRLAPGDRAPVFYSEDDIAAYMEGQRIPAANPKQRKPRRKAS